MKLGLLLLAAGVSLLVGADADFGEDTGFSGRVADCTTCHSPAHPTHDTAEVVFEGLPDTWIPGQTYDLTIAVTGGPPARSTPFAQGGFSLEAEQGTFRAAPGYEDDVYEPQPGRLSYTDQGSLTREWKVTWTAPDLQERPQNIRFWLAVLSADGGHAIGTDMDDQSERYDSTATTTASVPADPTALDAWRAMPLQPPALDQERYEARPGETVIMSGRHTDDNATELWWRIGDGRWNLRETGTEWRLQFMQAPSGTTDVWIRSGSIDRDSPTVHVVIDAPGPLTRLVPAHSWTTPLLLTLAIAWRHRP